jgi:hypothetical protein
LKTYNWYEGDNLNAHVLTLLALLGVLSSCHKDRVLKPEVNRTNRVESKNVENQTEYEAPVDESVNIPAQITGAYLVCLKLSSDPATYQQKVGCRVEADGVIVDDFKERADRMSWTQKMQGSAVDIRLLTGESAKGWLALFSVQADPTAIQSKVSFDLSFAMDGITSSVKTDLVMIWNEDCALPPIQFESIGDRLGAGTAIADQFRESHGVRFSTLSGTPVVLAQFNQTNPNPIGYYGGPTNVGNFLASDQNGGRFFVTDRHKQAEMTDTLVIEYDKAVKEASMDLVDIDFSETYVIRALNAQNQIVNEVQVAAQTVGARDGQLSHHVVRTPDGSATITKLHIFGFNPPGALGIGFGIDNIALRCAR